MTVKETGKGNLTLKCMLKLKRVTYNKSPPPLPVALVQVGRPCSVSLLKRIKTFGGGSLSGLSLVQPSAAVKCFLSSDEKH